MSKRNQGMLPGESMKTSLITIHAEGELDEDGDVEERRPDFYIAVMRHFKKRWTVEILKAEPITNGKIPHEVFERIIPMRQRIIQDERIERGKEQAHLRKVAELDKAMELRETTEDEY